MHRRVCNLLLFSFTMNVSSPLEQLDLELYPSLGDTAMGLLIKEECNSFKKRYRLTVLTDLNVFGCPEHDMKIFCLSKKKNNYYYYYFGKHN